MKQTAAIKRLDYHQEDCSKKTGRAKVISEPMQHLINENYALIFLNGNPKVSQSGRDEYGCGVCETCIGACTAGCTGMCIQCTAWCA